MAASASGGIARPFRSADKQHAQSKLRNYRKGFTISWFYIPEIFGRISRTNSSGGIPCASRSMLLDTVGTVRQPPPWPAPLRSLQVKSGEDQNIDKETVQSLGDLFHCLQSQCTGWFALFQLKNAGLRNLESLGQLLVGHPQSLAHHPYPSLCMKLYIPYLTSLVKVASSCRWNCG